MFLERIAEIDRQIDAGSKRTAASGRGLSMKALRKLGDFDDARDSDRRRAILFVRLYLQDKRDLSRRTAEAALRSYTNRQRIDVRKLEQRARSRRAAKDGSVRLEQLAEWIVDLASKKTAVP